ncbi:hypothetical protein FGO68_gene766 [Halteria grandinella]|uniref:Uncharacterized protein n=1 Tax=Halteria grandinella TaxID=5974 RepID=A0A8J8P831_HALGN|nr:hypothetical protein FGO68_gene766 [Halteria grandinella]
MDYIIEIENFKKEIAENANRIKEVHDFLDAEYRPVRDFVRQNQSKLEGTISSYVALHGKISEMETYDDQLKQKYLKDTLKQVNDIRDKIINEQKVFKVKQKEEREQFLQRMKVVETDSDHVKSQVEYVRRVIQQHKFFGGCYAIPSPPDQSKITSGTPVAMDTSLFTQDGTGPGNTQRTNVSQAFGQASLMQPSLPHQIVFLSNQLGQLQSDLAQLDSFAKDRIGHLVLDIDELRNPLNTQVMDLKKENESFLRELERLDQQYKEIFGEYTGALDANRDLVEKQVAVEKKLSAVLAQLHGASGGNGQNGNNFINNATIQYFAQPPATASANKRQSETLDIGFQLDNKLIANNNASIWRRRQRFSSTLGGGIANPRGTEGIDEPRVLTVKQKVALAKKKLEQIKANPTVMIDEEDGELKLFASVIKTPIDKQARAKTTMAQRSPGVQNEDELENKDASGPPGSALSGAKRSKVVVAFGSTLRPNDSLGFNNTLRSSAKDSPSMMGRYTQQSPDSAGLPSQNKRRITLNQTAPVEQEDLSKTPMWNTGARPSVQARLSSGEGTITPQALKYPTTPQGGLEIVSNFAQSIPPSLMTGIQKPVATNHTKLNLKRFQNIF